MSDQIIAGAAREVLMTTAVTRALAPYGCPVLGVPDPQTRSLARFLPTAQKVLRALVEVMSRAVGRGLKTDAVA